MATFFATGAPARPSSIIIRVADNLAGSVAKWRTRGYALNERGVIPVLSHQCKAIYRTTTHLVFHLGQVPSLVVTSLAAHTGQGCWHIGSIHYDLGDL